MLDATTQRRLAQQLEQAQYERKPLRQFSRLYPQMSIEDAYAIQRHWVELKIKQGHAIKGRKIGLTSRAMQVAAQIEEPDYAALLDNMFFEQGADLPVSQFIVPRVEVELAFVLKSELIGPAATLLDVLRATEFIIPAVEIIDARIEQFDRETKAPRRVVDTIADLAACAGIITGGLPVPPMGLDLRWQGALLSRNGVIEESGLAAAVLNHPAVGVAWLANKLARHDESLKAGDIVLSGSFTRPVAAGAGDTFHVDYGRLGSLAFRFV